MSYSFKRLMETHEETSFSKPFREENNLNVNETAVTLYSSGTTGLPKAVMLSHLNFCAALMNQSDLGEHGMLSTFRNSDNQERLLVPLPLFHIYGLINSYLISFFQGARVIVLPDFGRENLLKCIKEYKPTSWVVVPPMLKYFVNSDQIKPDVFSCVKAIVSASASLGESWEKKFASKFPGTKLLQNYGLTEVTGCTAPQLTWNIQNQVAFIFSLNGRSVGVLAPGTYAKVIDTLTGSDLGPNERGELLLMGSQIMKVYMNDKKATDDAINSEGWLHTGDTALYDEDGCIFIVDRLKEIIKYKAFQISPSELENILKKMPLILDAAVIGVKAENDNDEEVPKAFVVRKDDSLNENDVIKFLDERVIDYKRLRGGVEFIDKIPASVAGKIARKQLQSRLKHKRT